MIDYERRNWWRISLAFHGTVLPAVLGRVGLLTGFSLLLCFLDLLVLEHFGYGLPHLDQLGHSVLGVAMGMFIVFRTNSSNNRYWEGRTHWGTLVNCSRSLARLGAVYAGPAEELARLIAAYVRAVKQTLRRSKDLTEIRHLVPGRLYEQASAASNPPSMLAQAMSEWVRQRLVQGRFDSIAAMTMENQITTMVDAQGGCEKILKTPLPFAYAALIKQLLLLYLGSLPFVLVKDMQWAAPVVVAVVSFGMLGIEEAGVEIEAPFGLELNHLPLDEICENIARDSAALTRAHEPIGI